LILALYGAQRSFLAQDDIALRMTLLRDSPTFTLHGPGILQCEIRAQVPCFEYCVQFGQKNLDLHPQLNKGQRTRALDALSHLAAQSCTGRSVNDPSNYLKQKEMKAPDAYRKEKVAFSTVPKVICNQEARQ
jgi:hypothetical protein